LSATLKMLVSYVT